MVHFLWVMTLISCTLTCLHSKKADFVPRKVTKESLVETSSNITESLMSISRMMAEQVNQSEDTIGTLGKNKTLLCPCVDEILSGL